MTITALERTQTMPASLPARPLRVVEPAPLPGVSPRYVRPLRLVPPVDASTPVTRSIRPGLRLTRRGRLALTLTVAVVVGVLGVIAAQSPEAQPARGVSAGSIVVQPGDTLWAVAVRADPQADPRVTVERIAKLNGITDAAVRPGQRLRLPVR
ncbi:MAG: LysM peptidoglycan-binding domain-containing protein [Actinomycetota bacterium]|nr:LysM peptidoglycan-binding domain-containing protein [Actinomycetota bacterium]